MPVYNVDYKSKRPFEKITNKSNKYILKSFDKAIKLVKSKKIVGFINCPISKEILFTKKNHGITEYLSKKTGKNQMEELKNWFVSLKKKGFLTIKDQLH